MLENERCKLLWTFQSKTNITIKQNRPDTAAIDKQGSMQKHRHICSWRSKYQIQRIQEFHKILTLTQVQKLWNIKRRVLDSNKFCGNHSFPNFANGTTSHFIFSKYFIEYQNVKIDSEIKISK